MGVLSVNKLVILSLLLAVLVLGCTSERVERQGVEIESKPSAEDVTGEDSIEGITEETLVVEETTKEKPSSELFNTCIQECLELNKDSSMRNIENWFVENSGYCSEGCIEAGFECSVTSFHGEKCIVGCDSDNIAKCS